MEKSIGKKDIMQNMRFYIKHCIKVSGECGIIVDKEDLKDLKESYLTELEKEFEIKVDGQSYCFYPKGGDTSVRK